MKQTQSQVITAMCSKLTNAEKNDLKLKCNSIISLHKTMRGAYFYTPHGSADGRRSYEKKYSANSIIVMDNITFYVDQCTKCSCRKVYYKLDIITDVKTNFNLNIGFINKILEALQSLQN